MRLLALSAGVTAAAAVCTQCPLPPLNVTAFMPCLKQPVGEECCVVGRPMVNDPCVKVWLANPMLAPYKGVVEKARTACAVSKMADCEPAVATACPTECGAPAAPVTNLPSSLSPRPRPDTMIPVGGPGGMMGSGMVPPGLMNMPNNIQMPPPGVWNMPNTQMPLAGLMPNMMPMRPQGEGCSVCPLPKIDPSTFAPCLAKTPGVECCAVAKPMVENPCAKVWLSSPALAPFKSIVMQAATACNITKLPECNEAVAKVCPKECGKEKFTACRERVANQTAACAGKIGCAISQCMPDGSFSPRQCHGSTGYCWCVDKDGKEVNGSRAAPGGAAANCEPAKEKTPCQKRAEADATECGKKIGCDQTKCNDDGSYVPKQCRGSTGYCWCVDKDGKEVDGSKKGPGQTGEVNCAAAEATTPSECNCPPVQCAPGWVKKLKLGTEGCCKQNYHCVPSEVPNAESMREGKAADPAMKSTAETAQTRGSVSVGRPKNRGGKKGGKKPTKAPTASP